MNDLLLAADRGLVAIFLLLDLSAAFDTINHDILLALLRDQFGVKDNVLVWFLSYLKGRIQTINLGQTTSTPASLLYGVPHVSILGPLLFCVYMTPLGQIICKHNMMLHIYADDTQIYYFLEPNSPDSRAEPLRECKLVLKIYVLG